MPSVERILQGLQTITNSWQALAVFWHVYFGSFLLVLALGLRPGRRLAGLLLVPPLLSVSLMAWLGGNPFNGFVFVLVALLTLVVSLKVRRQPAQIAPPWFLFPGLALVAFGWAYPHFLAAASPLAYLYAAPSGLIPCPTLSLVIGLTLTLNGLGSRALGGVLGGAGLLYGLIGVFRLGVIIDWTLLLGAALLLVQAARAYRPA